MRWVVFVLAIIGAGGSGFVGFIWRDTVAQHGMARIRQSVSRNPQLKELYKFPIQLDNATYFLMAGLPLGIIGAILALARRGILAFLVLLAAWAGPAALMWELLLKEQDILIRWGIFTGALLLAALLAFLIRPKKVIPEDERAYAGV